jgi:hypothetical protein
LWVQIPQGTKKEKSMYRGMKTRLDEVVDLMKSLGLNVTIEDHPNHEVMIFENGVRLRASGNKYDGGFFCADKENTL